MHKVNAVVYDKYCLIACSVRVFGLVNLYSLAQTPVKTIDDARKSIQS